MKSEQLENDINLSQSTDELMPAIQTAVDGVSLEVSATALTAQIRPCQAASPATPKQKQEQQNDAGDEEEYPYAKQHLVNNATMGPIHALGLQGQGHPARDARALGSGAGQHLQTSKQAQRQFVGWNQRFGTIQQI